MLLLGETHLQSWHLPVSWVCQQRRGHQGHLLCTRSATEYGEGSPGGFWQHAALKSINKVYSLRVGVTKSLLRGSRLQGLCGPGRPAQQQESAAGLCGVYPPAGAFIVMRLLSRKLTFAVECLDVTLLLQPLQSHNITADGPLKAHSKATGKVQAPLPALQWASSILRPILIGK